MTYNFEGNSYNEILGISIGQAEEFAVKISKIQHEILDNISEYTFPGEGEHKGDTGYKKGNILKRFFDEFKEENERFLLLVSFDGILHQIKNKHIKKELRDNLDAFLDSLKNFVK